MKLAHRIIITVAGEDIELRPSLRFAVKLASRPGSLGQIVREINEGSLTIAVELISDHTGMGSLNARVFDVLPSLRGPLLAYVMACAGIDPTDLPSDEEREQTSKSVPFEEHLLHLYRLGTGWMGWTPADTLDATPLEILEAYKGRTEMLKAIFGGSDGKPASDDRPLNAKFRSIFAGHQIIREEA